MKDREFVIPRSKKKMSREAQTAELTYPVPQNSVLEPEVKYPTEKTPDKNPRQDIYINGRILH